MRIVRIPWTQKTRHACLALAAAGFAVSGAFSFDGSISANGGTIDGSGQDAMAAAWKCPTDIPADGVPRDLDRAAAVGYAEPDANALVIAA